MPTSYVSAIFDDRRSAEHAVTRLRDSGVPERAIGVISRHSDDEPLAADHRSHDEVDNKGSGALKGAGAGAGVGALFGLGALLIPGVGPFVAAGTFLETLGAVGSGVATGAIIGGSAGGVAGLLMDYGVSEDDASDYEERIRNGAYWVAVDTDRAIMEADTVAGILRAAGGELRRSTPAAVH